MTSPRPDTRYLATSPITTDLGQRETNLTTAAPGGYEANSARTAITGGAAGRSIELIADIDTTSTGVLVSHGATGGYRIQVAAGGVVEFVDASGTLASLTAPNAPAPGTPRSYVIAWSSEPNALKTVLGDALRSEFLVYDVASGTLVWAAVNHALPTVSATGTFTVGGVYTGGMMTNTYTPAIDAVRISCRFHTRVETREHFVAQTAAPTVVGIQACEGPRIPAGMIEPGAIVGPAYQFAAASMQPGRNRHRLLSQLWCIINPSPASIADNMRDALGHKMVYDLPGGEGWQCPVGWICKRYIPHTATHLQVLLQWVNYTLDEMVAMTEVQIRLHCTDALPGQQTLESKILYSRTNDDGPLPALGERVVLDHLPVVRNAQTGYSYLWWSMRTDEGSGSGNSGYQVRGWSVTPVVYATGGGAWGL